MFRSSVVPLGKIRFAFEGIYFVIIGSQLTCVHWPPRKEINSVVDFLRSLLTVRYKPTRGSCLNCPCTTCSHTCTGGSRISRKINPIVINHSVPISISSNGGTECLHSVESCCALNDYYQHSSR